VNTQFEQRLERELIEAARRQAGSGAARPSRPPRRRPPRVALTAAVACLALAALAVLVVALPGRYDAATPSPAQQPRQCDRLAASGELRLTDAPVDSRLLAAFGVLRRPQDARDRSICPSLAPNFVTLDPGAIRFADRNVLDRRVFLVPVANNRTLPPPGHAQQRPSGPQLCYVSVNRRGSAAGSCYPPEFFARGRFFAGGSGPHGSFAHFGVFPDGVAGIELHFEDGSRRTVPVRGNVVSFSTDGRRATPTNTVVRIRLLDVDGRVLETRATHNLRPAGPPASTTRRP
jgi:hypothetical protein